jgi:hypothetical protein
VNFKKAKWGLWISETEACFANLPLPTSCSTGEKVFRKVLNDASKHHIPAGYRTDFLPGLSREPVDLTKKLDRLQNQNPQDPEIPWLNTLISQTVTSDAKLRWRETVESSNHRSNPEKHWKLLRILSGKRPHNQPSNQPIHFKDQCFSKPHALATRFCKQFTCVTDHKSSKSSRCVTGNLRKKHCLYSNFKPFTDALTKKAINESSRSTAVGPDGLSSLHLHFLGPLGIRYLASLYNLAHANIPSIWKRANIIPIPKPGKPLTKAPVIVPSPSCPQLLKSCSVCSSPI